MVDIITEDYIPLILDIYDKKRYPEGRPRTKCFEGWEYISNIFSTLNCESTLVLLNTKLYKGLEFRIDLDLNEKCEVIIIPLLGKRKDHTFVSFLKERGYSLNGDLEEGIGEY